MFYFTGCLEDLYLYCNDDVALFYFADGSEQDFCFQVLRQDNSEMRRFVQVHAFCASVMSHFSEGSSTSPRIDSYSYTCVLDSSLRSGLLYLFHQSLRVKTTLNPPYPRTLTASHELTPGDPVHCQPILFGLQPCNNLRA